MALSSAVEGDGGQWWAVVGGEGWGGGRGASALIRCRGRGRPDQPSSDNKPMPQVKRKLVTYHLTSTSLCLPAPPPGHIVREQSVRGGIFFIYARQLYSSKHACLPLCFHCSTNSPQLSRGHGCCQSSSQPARIARSRYRERSTRREPRPQVSTQLSFHHTMAATRPSIHRASSRTLSASSRLRACLLSIRRAPAQTRREVVARTVLVEG